LTKAFCCAKFIIYWHPGDAREFFDLFDAQVEQRRVITDLLPGKVA